MTHAYFLCLLKIYLCIGFKRIGVRIRRAGCIQPGLDLAEGTAD